MAWTTKVCASSKCSTCLPYGDITAVIAVPTHAKRLGTGVNTVTYDDAIAQCQKAFKADPDFYYTHHLLGWAYNLKDMHREAIAPPRKSLELKPDPFAEALLISSLVKFGERAETGKLRDDDATRRYVPSYFLA